MANQFFRISPDILGRLFHVQTLLTVAVIGGWVWLLCLSIGLMEKRAHGRVMIVNDLDVPVKVTLWPHSFTRDESGKMKLMMLDDSVSVEMSHTLLSIPPHKTKWVRYKAYTKNLPKSFVFYMTFVPDIPDIVLGRSATHVVNLKPGDSHLEGCKICIGARGLDVAPLIGNGNLISANMIM